MPKLNVEQKPDLRSRIQRGKSIKSRNLSHVFIQGFTGVGKTFLVTEHPEYYVDILGMKPEEILIYIIEIGVDVGRSGKNIEKCKYPECFARIQTQDLPETKEFIDIVHEELTEHIKKYPSGIGILLIESGTGMYHQLRDSYIIEVYEKTKSEKQMVDRKLVKQGKVRKGDGSVAHHKSLLDPRTDYGNINSDFLELFIKLKYMAVTSGYNLWVSFPLSIKTKKVINKITKKEEEVSFEAPNLGETAWRNISAMPDYIFEVSVEQTRKGKQLSNKYFLECKKNASGHRFLIENPTPEKLWNKIKGD